MNKANNVNLNTVSMSERIKQGVKDYIVLTLGTLLYVLGWEIFLIPHGIASGGLTGACTIIQFGTGIPVAYSFFVINLFLLVIGFMVLGRGFGIRTIYAILLSTAFFAIFGKMTCLHSVPGNFLWVDNKILATIVGGLMEAVGIGFIFLRGGSTGGTDVLVLIMNKFWPITVGKVYLYTDIFIISSQLLVGKTFGDMLYGYLAMVIFSYTIDFVILGSKSTVKVLVFSDKYEEIADFIMKNLDRGVTALNSVGMYTKESRKVLLVLIRKSQLPVVTKAIKDIDRDAFVTISQVSSVYGEGFDELKTGFPTKDKNDDKLQ